MKPRSSPQTDDSAREKSSDALGQGKISRLVAGFALSALAGLALNSIYSLTDALFVSRGVGDAAMGGVLAVFPFVLLQSAVSTAIGGGAATLVAPEGLAAADFMLDEASVMATENLVMAAATAPGRTVLYNTACEPHVQDLCRMLNAMGADISGIGTNRLVIQGVPHLRGGRFRVGGDIIEAASYLAAAAATGGSLTLEGVAPADMAVLEPAFRKFGVRWHWESEGILRLPPRQRLRTAYDLGAAIPKIEDGPWPMLPSDLLSVLIVLATQTRGTELFFEKMFESRLYFVDHLIGMGAKIVQCDPHRAVVTGPTALQASTVTSPDIRAGMALIVAALCARGQTVIHNAESIDRGYESVEANLRALGADVRREP